MLSLNGFAIGYGELLTLCSAVIYAGHIIALGRLSEPGTALSLSVVQMAVITVICGVAALWPADASGIGIQLPGSGHDWLIVIYLALIAGALTMVLQTWAQARVEASRAAVIMAMEPVWAAAFAVALGGESITVRMVIGGLAILAAMYLVELAPRSAAATRGRGLVNARLRLEVEGASDRHARPVGQVQVGRARPARRDRPGRRPPAGRCRCAAAMRPSRRLPHRGPAPG